MHPSSAGATRPPPTALPDSARGLIEMAFGLDERPAVDDGDAARRRRSAGELLDALRGVLGAEHVLTDDETRRLRTRGKSTPDLLRARAGDLSDAPDAVVRPGSHDEVAAVLAWAVEHHVAVVPFGGGTCVTGGLAARRDGFAGLVSLDLVRMKRLRRRRPRVDDRGARAGAARPGGRGAARRGGADARPLPAVLRVRHDRRLRGHPLVAASPAPATAASTRSSSASGSPRRAASSGSAPHRRTPPGPDLRQLFLGSEGAFGVITEVTVRVRRLPEREGLRGLALAVLRRRRRRDAHAGPGRAAADGAPALRRGRDRDQPGPPRRDRRRVRRRLPDDHRLRGHARARSPPSGPRSPRCSTASAVRRSARRPATAWAHGRFNAPYLRDSLLDVGVLVETLETATFWSNREALYAGVKAALEQHAGRGDAGALPHLARLRDRLLALLHGRRQGSRPTRCRSGWPPRPPPTTRSSPPARPSPTTTRSAPTTSRGWSHEIGELGASVLRAVKADLDPTGVLNPGVLIP